jgi:hypothetical protein
VRAVLPGSRYTILCDDGDVDPKCPETDIYDLPFKTGMQVRITNFDKVKDATSGSNKPPTWLRKGMIGVIQDISEGYAKDDKDEYLMNMRIRFKRVNKTFVVTELNIEEVGDAKWFLRLSTDEEAAFLPASSGVAVALERTYERGQIFGDFFFKGQPYCCKMDDLTVVDQKTRSTVLGAIKRTPDDPWEAARQMPDPYDGKWHSFALCVTSNGVKGVLDGEEAEFDWPHELNKDPKEEDEPSEADEEEAEEGENDEEGSAEGEEGEEADEEGSAASEEGEEGEEAEEKKPARRRRQPAKKRRASASNSDAGSSSSDDDDAADDEAEGDKKADGDEEESVEGGEDTSARRRRRRAGSPRKKKVRMTAAEKKEAEKKEKERLKAMKRQKYSDDDKSDKDGEGSDDDSDTSSSSSSSSSKVSQLSDMDQMCAHEVLALNVRNPIYVMPCNEEYGGERAKYGQSLPTRQVGSVTLSWGEAATEDEANALQKKLDEEGRWKCKHCEEMNHRRKEKCWKCEEPRVEEEKKKEGVVTKQKVSTARGADAVAVRKKLEARRRLQYQRMLEDLDAANAALL